MLPFLAQIEKGDFAAIAEQASRGRDIDRLSL
jgi:hypothetical protein